ncbi:hypothetical protein C0995_014598 [Termitomyces sp. Mi166|nr:hypothetical protein C0995_014598 [Termitomyces sp. Mi166\
MARLPTVYDFSSLRLYPDGSRVQQKSKAAIARVVQDSRGNWLVRDAAGSGAVGRYRKVREEKEGLEEKWNDVDEGEEDDSFKDRGKGKEKEIPRRRHNPRPAKRQKFSQDFDFLTPTASTGSSSIDALPSSDLLRSRHYLASSYYHERGQLFNATQDYRQMREQNRPEKLEQQKKIEADRENSEELDEDSQQEEANRPRRGGRKKGVTGKIEYVSCTLEVRIPNGWEDMMRDADVGEEAAIYSHGDGELIGLRVKGRLNGDDDDDEENKGPQDDGDEHEEEEEEETEEDDGD